MRAGQEELIKHIRGVRTDVKTERSVIQDEIKTEESACRNTIYTTRASPRWTTTMLAVQKTGSLPLGMEAEAALEEDSESRGEEGAADVTTFTPSFHA
jgi:hypothetical protein